MNAARTPWSPWMAWMDIAASMQDMALNAGQVVAQRGARMAAAGSPLSTRDRREFTLMGVEKAQAAGEAMLAMFSPMIINGGALSMKLGEMAWRQMMRNARLMRNWSPMAFASPAQWASAPIEASTRAMADAVQQGNYLSATANDAAQATVHISRAASRVAKRGIAPVKRRVKANARRLAKR